MSALRHWQAGDKAVTDAITKNTMKEWCKVSAEVGEEKDIFEMSSEPFGKCLKLQLHENSVDQDDR